MKEKEKLLRLVNRSENYFYKYLLTNNKDYIDKFFTNMTRVKRLIKK